MIERLEERYFQFNRWLSPAGSVVAILFGLSILIGWVWNIRFLRSIPGETYQAKPLTALGLMIGGAALFFICVDRGPGWFTRVGQFFAFTFGLFGVYIVADHLITTIDLGSGSLFFGDQAPLDPLVPSGRPAIETGVIFVLAAFSIFGLVFRKRIAILAANLAAVVALMLALVAVILYFFDFRVFDDVPILSSIALNTAITVLVLLFAALHAYRERGFLAILWSRTGGGLLARRLFPFIFIVPVGVGWLRHQGEKGGLYTTEFGIALFTAGTIIGFALIVFLTARSVEYYDLRRQAAEAAEVRKALMIGISLEPVILWSPEQGIVEWNAGCEKLYGFTAEEAKRQSSLGLLKTRMKANLADFWDHLEKEGSWTGEVEQTTRTGETVVTESTYQLIESEGERFVIQHDRDITERKRYEQAIIQAKELNDYTINSLPAIFFLFDSNGRMIKWNQNFLRVTGYTADEVRRMLPLDFIFPGDHELVADKIREVMSTGQAESEARLMTADARVVPFYFLGSRITVEGQLCVVGSGTDITEQKRAIAAIKESEERYRLLFESNPCPMWVYDRESLGFLAVNQAATNAYGYSRREFLAMDMTKIRPEEELPRFYKHLAGDIKTVTHPSPWIHKRKDGSTFDVEITSHALEFNGRPARLVLATDVTERNRAVKQLRESEQRFRRMFDIVSIGIAQADAQTGQFLLFNRRFAEIAGYPPEELKQMTFKQLTHPDDAEKDARKYFEARDGKAPQYINEKRYLRADGSVVWVRVNASFVRDADGTALQSIGVIEDITEQKRARDELLELNVTLEQRVEERTRKLETLNRELEAFSYSVSHDLRAPLRAMDGFSQAVLEDYGDKLDETGVDYLNRIRSASQRMASMIDSLLVLSRVSRSALSIVTTDLSSLAREIAAELEAASPERSVEVIIEDGLAAECDARLARIALENMLGNAWKFTSKTDNASISFSRGLEPGEYVIRDNGAGFEEIYADKIFGAFSRLHRSDEFEGTGIGLATVYRIIQMHGGTIRAESEPGHGAAFYFKFKR